MNQQRIKRLLDDIEHELGQAQHSYSLVIQGERYAPQVDNLVSSVTRIATDCRTILRTLGVEK
jgi:hypothetical protein